MLRRRPAPTTSRLWAALFGLLLAAAAAVLAAPLLPGGERVRAGDRAPHTIPAAHAAQYESRALTEAARVDAARQVPDVRTPLDLEVGTLQVAALDRLMSQVRNLRMGATGLQQQLAELSTIPAAAPIGTSARAVILQLDRTAFEDFARRTHDAVADIMGRPVARGEVNARVDDYLQSKPGAATARDQDAFRDTVRAFVAANVSVDEQATQRARDEARNRVPAVVVTYTRGQVIVSEGQTLDAAALEALEATGVTGSGFDAHRWGGAILLAVGLGVLLGGYLYLLQPFPAGSARRMFLALFVIVAALAAARVTLPEVTPDRDHHYLAFGLPVAAAALIVAGLADLSFAAVVAAAVGVAAAVIGAVATDLPGSGFIDSVEALQLALAYTAGGLAGAAAIHRAERLSRYGLSAVAVAAATGLVLAAFWLIGEPRSNDQLGWIGGAAVAAGLGSAFIAAGVFVVLSMVFGVTTRLQLMELGQSGHPLLRRLQDEAPGTYHHSMMVGALAERAADRVGADALVTRVGAYFHDIGKLSNPVCFIENMLEGTPSPHEHLAPEESARIIRAHITDGLEIARRHRLPEVIRMFIPEHHGTRLVTYFYRRAARNGGAPDPAPFRYAGPRPSTKESAIVMLADSCEAIVRANHERTAAGIDEVVDGVFAERLAEGQLDDCDLTMRDLQQVAASFKATLRAVYHPRIVYPSPAPEELARVAGGGG